MDTSNPDKVPSSTGARGAFADGLTFVRLLLAVIIFIVILAGWPSVDAAILVTVLFACGALTDLFDDMLGGPGRSQGRMFGWFDDIADAVLIGATLLGLLYVTYKSGTLGWAFAVPAIAYIARDALLGLFKGFEFNKSGAPLSRLGDIKSALAMFGVTLMLASPWLQLWIDRTLAGDDPEKLAAIYNTPSPWVWQAGQALLWIAAILSVYLFVRYMTAKPVTPESDVS